MIFFPLSVLATTQSTILPSPIDESGITTIQTKTNVWSANASIGYSYFSNMNGSDGKTALGRFSIDRSLYRSNRNETGLELGIQTGNTARLSLPDSTIEAISGMPIDLTIKPILDFLLTFQINIPSSTLFLITKGGIAYRQLEFFSESNSDLSEINPEIQMGLGSALTRRTRLSLLYQGIYSEKSPDFTLNMTTLCGHIASIPTQHSVILNLSVIL